MLSEERKWMVVSGGAAFVAAALTRYLLKSGWARGTGREPPVNPASPHVHWREAVAWAFLTGAAASLTRLVAERGSAAGWRRATGKYPRPLRRKRAKR